MARKTIKLKKGSYESAKISVMKGSLYSDDVFNNLKKLSFDEILKFLEENGFRDSIDKSYIQFEGFSLIERVLNLHMSKVYKHVISSASKQNREFLESYYLKYQIHNIMVVLRCLISGEKDVTSYLIGDDRLKEKFVKASNMPKVEDALVYLVKKFSINPDSALEEYKKGIYNLENYLYKVYYSRLVSKKFSYNGIDEKKFFFFIRKYIDILNARTFLKLKVEKIEEIDFNDLYFEGGNLNLNFYEKLKDKSIGDVLEKFSNKFGDNFEKCRDFSCIFVIDKLATLHKKQGNDLFKQIKFGSPFYTLKFLFLLELQMAKLRVLLKMKYMDLPSEEFEGLVSK